MKFIILSLTKKLDFNINKYKSYEDPKKSYPKKITKAMLHNLLSTMSNNDDNGSNDKCSN